ncbi:MAG: hypothetical protein GY855_11640 [candidate division Zixibacteria bacterium]|nr:hypothetical protein [candidate division Zixibacteria bacterium]
MKTTVSDEQLISLEKSKYSRNPLFMFNNNRELIWFNNEFKSFIEDVLPNSSVEAGFDIIVDRLDKHNQSLFYESTSRHLKFDENSSVDDEEWLHSYPVGIDDKNAAVIGQISSEPLLSNDSDSFRNYSIASVINQLGRHLGKSYRLEETLKIILIGVTAREGFGFNRAFMLLYDDDSRVLKGVTAIGPSSGEEAAAIWSKLDGDQKSLSQLIEDYNNATEEYDVRVNELVRAIDISVDELYPPLADLIKFNTPGLITKRSEGDNERGRELFDILGVDTFAAAPLTVEDNMVGVLLADNLITGKEITDSNLEVLGIFANHAGAALERSRLYEKLGLKVEQLAHTNELLRESQKKLIDSEKLSAVGEMASQVAHEIRNPLAVVGGYARNIRKKINDKQGCSESLDIIISEVERIETVLDNFTSITKAAPENKSILDFSNLVNEVLQIAGNVVQNPHKIFQVENFVANLKTLGSEKQLRNALLTFSKQFAKNSEGFLQVAVSLNKESDKIALKYNCKKDINEESHSYRVFSNIFNTSALKRDTELIIANEIIKKHSGNVEIQCGKNQPLSVVINLPIYKEQ